MGWFSNVVRATAVMAVAALLTTVNVTGADAVTYPTLVGHRGIGNPWTVELKIPEESIPAIQWAAAHHADVVEGDVQISGSTSSDPGGTMYMMHDETIDRTTNGTGSSTTRPWSYIKDRWLEIPVDTDGNGDMDNTKYHPPTFRAWLQAAKATGKLAFVELKNGDNWSASEVRRAINEIKNQGMQDRVILAASESDIATAKSTGYKKLSWGVDPSKSPSKVKSVVGSGNYATITLTSAEENRDYVDALKAAGIKVFLWTLTRDDHYARALPIGAYGWMCNNSDDAYKWLEAHGA